MEPITDSVPVDPIAFEKSFCLRVEACIAFLFKLSDTTKWENIS